MDWLGLYVLALAAVILGPALTIGGLALVAVPALSGILTACGAISPDRRRR